MKQIDREVYGPRALVIGASSGAGAEFARQVVASGINVVLVARSQERLRSVAASLQRDHQVETRTISLDLGRDGILDPIAEATDDLDVGLVVSNAGAGNPGPFRLAAPRRTSRHRPAQRHHASRARAPLRPQAVRAWPRRAGAGLGRGGSRRPSVHDQRQRDQRLPAQPRRGLHQALRSAGVDVTVLVPVLVKTPVVKRIGLEAIDLPVGAISAEEAIDQAFTALLEHRPTTIDHEQLAPLSARMKGAVVEAISQRLAASQPTH